MTGRTSTDHPNARWLGAAVGCGISTCIVVAAGLIDLSSRGNPTLPWLLAPTMLAGTLGGALLGPRAVRGDWVASAGSRFLIRLRLAVAAVVIGACVVGLQLGLDSYLRSDGAASLLGNLLGGLLIAPIGIVIYGPFVLPFTYVAALVWTWVMRRQAPPRST